MFHDEACEHPSLEMALIDDEALVVLARECDYGPARDEILVRYRPQTERLVNWLSRSTEFGATDVEDAHQNSVFWTVEAIGKFDTLQPDAARRCSFYSFLHRVVVARYKDFTKHLRRVERRRVLSGDPLEPAPTSGDTTAHSGDPAALAERAEASLLLKEALGKLDPECREIWERLCCGQGLREIAGELGLSYDAAKRRRRKLIGELKLLLRSETGETARAADCDD
ncbi:MAG: sigma-70 family RNA polymerase sigma factor [Lacipirellulaceae bacterium]